MRSSVLQACQVLGSEYIKQSEVASLKCHNILDLSQHQWALEAIRYSELSTLNFYSPSPQGRPLRVSDQLTLGSQLSLKQDEAGPVLLPKSLILVYPQDWVIQVLAGPHNDAEFLTPQGNTKSYSTKWSVISSSNRMGIWLESNWSIDWACNTGGEGGSHLSNILDNRYALGTINVDGDTPVILMNEGPDMGGYVCLCTIATGER